MEKARNKNKRKRVRDEHLKYCKLAKKIWAYLNGRYEDYDKENEQVALIIYKYLEL